MKWLPDQVEIRAAELRVAQARLNARDSLTRVRRAMRETLSRPSTLIGIAAAAGLLSFCLALRPRPKAASSPDVGAVVAKTSALGLTLAFIVRYGMQHLPDVLQHVWTMHQQRSASERNGKPLGNQERRER